MSRTRSADPDGRVDADYGSGNVSAKKAAVIREDEYRERAAEREGLRDLDDMVESSPGLSRQQRDRERAMPRETTADLRHPATERRLPIPDSVRRPISSRQRKDRSVAKHRSQDRMPQTQYDAVHMAITDDSHWRQLNDVLSENAGDAQALTDGQRRNTQRLDRAIQTYEKNNDRGHVVYANVEMPPMINRSNLEGYVRNSYPSGSVVEFDRYTGGAHSMHEVDPETEQANRTAVFEIQTRRGIYLGRSDSLDDTTHILPRGLRFKVAGTHQASYERPDGSRGTRQVIQLAEVDDNEGAS